MALPLGRGLQSQWQVQFQRRVRLQACVEARRDAVAMDGTADNRIVPVYGENWVKGFARSQPAWFQRHLPDVYEEQQRLQPVSVRPAL